MKFLPLVLAFLLPSMPLSAVISDDEELLRRIGIGRRGDVNGDSIIDLADALSLSAYLYIGDEEPTCLAQADINDDGSIDVSDVTFLLNWLFVGGPQPPAPGPDNLDCFPDPTPPYFGCQELNCPDD